MYKNKYGETIEATISEHSLLIMDNNSYSSITKIINPFDLNITKNNPYQNEKTPSKFFLNKF